MRGRRVSPELREEILDYLACWRKRTGVAITVMLASLNLSTGKYYDWRKRREHPQERSVVVPKSHWLLPWEKEAIIDYRVAHSDVGYRRLTYMMLDEDVVAASPPTVYRVLKEAGLLMSQWRHTKAKGSGFVQPVRLHEHWHLDLCYINYKGTFVYLMALVDGYSRFIVHFEIKTSVQALDVEIMLERAREKFPDENPVLITDNGPQFIAREFRNYLQLVGITHRRTRFFHPQSNGKVERFFQTCKNESVRRICPVDLEDLYKQVSAYIHKYNTERLHSAIGHITPLDMMQGRQQEIFMLRDEKQRKAREHRATVNQNNRSLALRSSLVVATSIPSEKRNQGREQRAVGQP